MHHNFSISTAKYSPPGFLFIPNLINSVPGGTNASYLNSHREHSCLFWVCSVFGVGLLCSRGIISFSRAELLNVPLVISLSPLDVLSGPDQIKNVITKLREQDLKSKIFETQVHDLDSCLAIFCSIVRDSGLEKDLTIA